MKNEDHFTEIALTGQVYSTQNGPQIGVGFKNSAAATGFATYKAALQRHRHRITSQNANASALSQKRP